MTIHLSFVNANVLFSTGITTWAIASKETVSMRFFFRTGFPRLVADSGMDEYGVQGRMVSGSAEWGGASGNGVFLTFQERMQEGVFSPGFSATSNFTWYNLGRTFITVPTRRT